MDSIAFNKLLENSENIDDISFQMLDSIIQEFPYFQAAKTIQLKGYKNNNHYKYNEALKKTAAFTIDRKVLFEFITSLNFDKKATKEIEILEEIEVIEPETVKVLHNRITNLFKTTLKDEIKSEIIKEVEVIEDVEKIIIDKNEIEETNNANEVLEIGKPIQFSSSEPHSFNEWMQLISQKPIDREESTSNIEEISSIKLNKFDLIDKFIESNPKIKPVDKQAAIIDISEESNSHNESLMTETLAKVYLEQKKYDNALKAYRILSLKYPEKSSFFANRIKAIKILQKNRS